MKQNEVNINAQDFYFTFIYFLSSKLGKLLQIEPCYSQVTENWGGKIFINIQNNSLVKIKTNY